MNVELRILKAERRIQETGGETRQKAKGKSGKTKPISPPSAGNPKCEALNPKRGHLKKQSQ
jgi:hypothetical protein